MRKRDIRSCSEKIQKEQRVKNLWKDDHPPQDPGRRLDCNYNRRPATRPTYHSPTRRTRVIVRTESLLQDYWECQSGSGGGISDCEFFNRRLALVARG
jgi:hypothetical protein